MKSQRGYKVVEDAGSCLTSSVIGGTRPSAAVTYAKDKVTVPHVGNGPLCVFTSLYAATRFKNWQGGRLFACDYYPSRKRGVWWRLKNLGKRQNYCKLRILPTDTALADAVILREECH